MMVLSGATETNSVWINGVADLIADQGEDGANAMHLQHLKDNYASEKTSYSDNTLVVNVHQTEV